MYSSPIFKLKIMKRTEFNETQWTTGDVVKIGQDYYEVNTVGLTSGCVGVKTDEGVKWFKCNEFEVCKETSELSKKAVDKLLNQKDIEIKYLTSKIDKLQKNSPLGKASKTLDSVTAVLGNSTGLYNIIDRYVQQLRSATDKLDLLINPEDSIEPLRKKFAEATCRWLDTMMEKCEFEEEDRLDYIAHYMRYIGKVSLDNTEDYD